jgi:hypothetical protein
MPQCMHEARYDTPLYVPTRTEPPHCHARARTRELGLGGWSYTGTRPPAGTLHDPTTCMAELRTNHDRDRRQKAVAPKQAPLLHAWHGRRAGGRSEKRARARMQWAWAPDGKAALLAWWTTHRAGRSRGRFPVYVHYVIWGSWWRLSAPGSSTGTLHAPHRVYRYGHDPRCIAGTSRRQRQNAVASSRAHRAPTLRCEPSTCTAAASITLLKLHVWTERIAITHSTAFTVDSATRPTRWRSRPGLTFLDHNKCRAISRDHRRNRQAGGWRALRSFCKAFRSSHHHRLSASIHDGCPWLRRVNPRATWQAAMNMTGLLSSAGSQHGPAEQRKKASSCCSYVHGPELRRKKVLSNQEAQRQRERVPNNPEIPTSHARMRDARATGHCMRRRGRGVPASAARQHVPLCARTQRSHMLWCCTFSMRVHDYTSTSPGTTWDLKGAGP